jgi:hypothetical protein
MWTKDSQTTTLVSNGSARPALKALPLLTKSVLDTANN